MRSDVARREGWSEDEIRRDVAERAAGAIPVPIDAPRTAQQAAAIGQGMALEAQSEATQSERHD
jgi:hypothetical protein